MLGAHSLGVLAGHAILSSSPSTSSSKPVSEASTAACVQSCVVCVRSTSLHFGVCSRGDQPMPIRSDASTLVVATLAVQRMDVRACRHGPKCSPRCQAAACRLPSPAASPRNVACPSFHRDVRRRTIVCCRPPALCMRSAPRVESYMQRGHDLHHAAEPRAVRPPTRACTSG